MDRSAYKMTDTIVDMLSALAIALTFATATLTPTDDVWVYPHASDQLDSEFLRSWGGEGRAVLPGGEQTGAYSYSCLKFSIVSVAKGATLKKAVLRLTHDAAATWDEAQSKAAPLEARALTTKFDEKSWEFSMASTVAPSASENTIFGSGSGKPSADGKPFVIEIDLMKGPGKFDAVFAKALASNDPVLAFALTTKMDPQEAGEATMYKYYSRSAKEDWRPQLVLEYSLSDPVRARVEGR